MSELFEALFGKYGRVGKSPSMSNGKYGWLNYCYLDTSFRFLLTKPANIPAEILDDEPKFLAFFAGYIDAEGSFRIYQQDQTAAYSLRVNSEDESILRESSRALGKMGYHVYLQLGSRPNARNRYKRSLWALGMFRKAEILTLLKELPLIHGEKICWQRLMIEAADDDWLSLRPKVVELRSSIKLGVKGHCQLAEAKKLPAIAGLA